MSGETIFIKMLNDQGNLRDSYTDYWTMITLSGYKTCLLGEVDFTSDNVYIFAPDDGNSKAAFTTEAAKGRRCKLVYWALEWPRWKDGVLTGHEIPEYVDEMWVSDSYYLDLQRKYNGYGARKVSLVVLGGHPDFGDPAYAYRKRERWDVCHLMYTYGTREHKLKIIESHGLKIAPNGWGDDRDFILTNSRWGVHLQQFPMPFIAPQRFLLFASYGLPILTDYCANPWPYTIFQDALIHFDPRETSVMNAALRNEAVRANYDLVTKQMTFRSQVDDAVFRLMNPHMYYDTQGGS